MRDESAVGSCRRAPLWRPGVFAIMAVVLLAGCYRTSDLPGPVPELGTRIVADLTPAGTVQMEPWIGAEATGLEALVVGVRGEEWDLEVLRVDHRGLPSIRWNREQIVFPEAALRNVRERELDGMRTALFGAGLSATLFVLARNFMSAWVSGNGAPGDDPVF